MKILVLADPGSAHTIKWVKYLCEKGVNIFLFGLNEFKEKDYSGIENLKVESLKMDSEIFNKQEGNFSKINYLKALPSISRIKKEYKPDIVHAHYASSYGLLGALSMFHPFILSVYGSDVYSFPHKNLIAKKILQYNFSKADRLLSTSKIMAEEIKKYTLKHIYITPFGIDLNIFYPVETKEKLFNKEDIVVGTIKTMENKYGIQYLIKAFKKVKEKYPDIPLKLLLVGKGTEEDNLKKMVSDLGISDVTKFTGFISPADVSIYHNMLDISVFVSREESFGVSVLEASACEKPVIVSNVGGLLEVAEDNVTGIIVEKENVEQTSDAIEKLVLDKKLRLTLGQNGRKRVLKYFNIEDNVETMLNIYKGVLSKN
jgi:glycosyltransferase involved in cell wall biosynthesis